MYILFINNFQATQQTCLDLHTQKLMYRNAYVPINNLSTKRLHRVKVNCPQNEAEER